MSVPQCAVSRAHARGGSVVLTGAYGHHGGSGLRTIACAGPSASPAPAPAEHCFVADAITSGEDTGRRKHSPGTDQRTALVADSGARGAGAVALLEHMQT